MLHTLDEISSRLFYHTGGRSPPLRKLQLGRLTVRGRGPPDQTSIGSEKLIAAGYVCFGIVQTYAKLFVSETARAELRLTMILNHL